MRIKFDEVIFFFILVIFPHVIFISNITNFVLKIPIFIYKLRISNSKFIIFPQKDKLFLENEIVFFINHTPPPSPTKIFIKCIYFFKEEISCFHFIYYTLLYVKIRLRYWFYKYTFKKQYL